MKKALLGLFAAPLLLGGVIFWAASEPDVEVAFHREAFSDIPLEALKKEIFRPNHWPEWHHEVIRVRVEEQGRETPDLAVGRTVLMTVRPKGQPWRDFVLKSHITGLNPNGLIQLSVEGDSKGKLQKAFQSLQWTIQVESHGLGSKITGDMTGKTHSWRTRLFSKIAPRIMMNQAFYPDLIQLSQGEKKLEAIELTPSQ